MSWCVSWLLERSPCAVRQPGDVRTMLLIQPNCREASRKVAAEDGAPRCQSCLQGNRLGRKVKCKKKKGCVCCEIKSMPGLMGAV